MLEIRVGGKYRLGKRLAKSDSSEVFHGTNIQNNEDVAIKLRAISSPSPLLTYESKVLKIYQDTEGFPSVFWTGTELEFNVLVMELLGPTLKDLFSYCNKKLSLKTVLMVAEQILSLIENLHSKNFIHRDIKPENFLIGLGNKSKTIHMIGLKLSKKFKDTKNLKHIVYAEGKKTVGTIRYGSFSALAGVENARRDDIESFFYVIVYLMNGNLPWQALQVSKHQRHGRVAEMKRNALVSGIFTDLPAEILAVLTYARGLHFEETPDYAYLRSLIKGLQSKENLTSDFIFDWTVKTYKASTPLSGHFLKNLQGLSDDTQVVQDVSVGEHIDHPSPTLPEPSRSKCLLF